ncbi:MAG: hypothetical protein PVF15_01425 [Candidatus Bathyarchaeota archaeon]
MGLRKSPVKKGNPSVHNSGLLGIVIKTESANQMNKGEASFQVMLNLKTQNLLREVILEAEYRKAQAIALTRKMNFI